MRKIMFICHGNICRSPMAEFIFKKIVNEHGKENEYFIDSSATSSEEIDNDIYPPVKKVLQKMNIPFTKRKAKKIERDDYDKFDYFIVMDENNLINLSYIFADSKKKVHKLLEFCQSNKDVEDPWYTSKYYEVYYEIEKGCKALFKWLEKN